MASEFSVVARDVSVDYATFRLTRNRNSPHLLERIGLIPSRTRKRAVAHVTFATRKGESLGIVGRNGSGKSTLLRTLAGTEIPSTGEVWTSAKPTLLGINPALISDRTGIENIELGCYAMGLDPEQTSELIPKITEIADIGSAVHDPINTYSSGMGARLRFAISACGPATEILMIDEALGAGDAAFQARSEEAMQNILDNAGTVYYVSHAPQMVQRICKRAIWLYKGQIVMDGPSDIVPEEYRKWAMAVKNHKYEEAEGRIKDAIKAYKAPQIELI